MNRRALSCLMLAFLSSSLFAAEEATTRLVVPLIVDGAIHEIEPLLHSRVNAPVKVEYTSMNQLVQRLNNGEAMDVVVISKNGAQQFAAKGLVKSQYDLVQAEVGIAVADNAPTPVLKTSEDMVAFLKATPSIAYFMPGASGNLLLQFAEKNGIADIVKQKGVVTSTGFTSTLVREGKTASAIQQISELIAGGAKNIVPLPDSVQVRATTSVVVFNSAQRPDVAEKIAQVLTSSDAAAIYQRFGLIPIFNWKGFLRGGLSCSVQYPRSWCHSRPILVPGTVPRHVKQRFIHAVNRWLRNESYSN